ncbi:hypothetical protein NDU88_005446 [Pleurodeles waltl]|uniref:Uncharacterized protein n=1 Tax=Pleurodeles waltl TaxID=8319 RepID=A0AAV7W7U9_PLEWA|nr:hypothetical protein NDU88_005446 [Pleurodeles waltl]
MLWASPGRQQAGLTAGLHHSGSQGHRLLVLERFLRVWQPVHRTPPGRAVTRWQQAGSRQVSHTLAQRGAGRWYRAAALPESFWQESSPSAGGGRHSLKRDPGNSCSLPSSANRGAAWTSQTRASDWPGSSCRSTSPRRARQRQGEMGAEPGAAEKFEGKR